MTIDKTFDPAAIEARWYPHWEGQGLFRPARPEAAPFTIVMPPPNVTGSLHIGHALDVTLQDILVRHARLQGKDALWVVGTDHAGIATQMVVERNIASQGLTRTGLGRDAFVEHVWEWKAQSGGAITRQLRRLGASCDWAGERFTMDEGFSRAVTRVFVDLHAKGLIYRDKRLVNWDPHFRTAISDLEVEPRETAGSFWHLRYPLADGSGHVAVATTRPETLLADMAVAVHPDDARYAHLVGTQVRLPVTGRLVPIVADVHADPELGSGAVKITPGHDFNDFEVGLRAGLRAGEMLNMLDADARVCQTADGLVPADLLGLDRFEARDAVVARLAAEGALERVEPRTIQVPHGDRSGAVIEPWLTDQWYVDAARLAPPAIAAVRSGAIRIVPETWKKTWYHWLENIQPWCVSRQLWWGHRIPAWYGPAKDADGDLTYSFRPIAESNGGREFFVAYTAEEALHQARHYYGSTYRVYLADTDEQYNQLTAVEDGDRPPIVLARDPGVLDTWFSSALWPFGTLGWPEDETVPAPFVPSEVERREAGTAPVVSTSTALGTNGAGGGTTGLAAFATGGDMGSLLSMAGGLGIGPSASEVLTTYEEAAAPEVSAAPPTPAPAAAGLLARHYPNDVLVSGFDILFFWDARMAMQGLEVMGEVPWRTLYLHGLVRDASGAKMSKSKGNTVDPIGLIERYGADALRFTLAAMESQGRDIKLDERRVEGYRNFATKLWNAARFAQANGIGGAATIEPPRAALPVNRWILAETARTVQALDLALADLRFDEAANTVYHFVWDRFCDWYLELVKPALGADGDAGEAAETRQVAGWVLDQILAMLHPFMPFVTEELWHALAPREHDLVVGRWPLLDARAIDPAAVAEVEWLIRLVGELRAARTALNVPPGARLPLMVVDAGMETQARLDRHYAALVRLVRLEAIALSPVAPGGSAQVVVDEATFVLPLQGVIDLGAERARLDKAATAAEKERDGLAARLANDSFVGRARPEAVAKAREDHFAKAAEAERLRAALGRLG